MAGIRAGNLRKGARAKAKPKGKAKLGGAGNCGTGNGGFKPGNVCGKGARAKLAADLRAARAAAKSDRDKQGVRQLAKALQDHRRGKPLAIGDTLAGNIRAGLRAGNAGAKGKAASKAVQSKAAAKPTLKPAPKPPEPKPAPAKKAPEKAIRTAKNDGSALSRDYIAQTKAKIHAETKEVTKGDAYSGTIKKSLGDHKAGDEAVKAMRRVGEVHDARIAAIKAERDAISSSGPDYVNRMQRASRAAAANPNDSQLAEEARRAEDDFQKYTGRKEELNAKYRQAVKEANDDAHAILAAPNPTRVRRLDEVHESIRGHVDEGEGFVSRLYNDKGAGPLKIDYVAMKAGGRAYHSSEGNQVAIASTSRPDTVAHELGHAIEHQHPGVGKASLAFLRYRTGREKATSLKSLAPNSNYRDDERGWSDKFGKAFDDSVTQPYYVGKDYRSGATEILSMGIQKLMTDPVNFARKDPEYFKFVHGVLSGAIR